MELRPARPEEAIALVGLMHAAIDAHAPALYDAYERALWKSRIDVDRIERQIADAAETFLVATDRDAIMGLASRNGELVRYLYVHPDAGGRGVARALMDRVEAQARAEGVARLVLDASRNAIPVYRHLGYQESGKTGCGGADDILCTRMEKVLSAPERALSDTAGRLSQR